MDNEEDRLPHLIKYATFRPQPDITRAETMELINGCLFTIANRDGFTISMDDDMPPDDIICFIENLIALAWPSGQVIHGENTHIRKSFRHFKVRSIFNVRTGEETYIE